MSTSNSNSNTSDRSDDVITVGNPTRRLSSSDSSSPAASSLLPDSDQQNKNVNETSKSETSPGSSSESAFALYRNRAGSDSQTNPNHAQTVTSPGTILGSTFASIAAGTAFSLSPSLIAGGSTAPGLLNSAASAISSSNGVCPPTSQLTNVSSLFGTTSTVAQSPVAAAIANAINSTSNSLITNTPFVFGKGLFDRVTNGNNKDQEDASTNGTRTTPSTSTAPATASGGGFVFGQNLSDRVTNQQGTAEEQVKEGSDNNGQNEATSPSPFQNTTDPQSGTNQEPELFGANAALAQLNNTTVQVSTGEEGEKNVLLMNCKLYVYDKETSNWLERGQGQLRLNDPIRGTERKSRIIIRTAGTLRLLLNTQVWEGIDLKPAADRKCLRLVGRDELNDHKMHVFMIKCPNEDDAAKLNRALCIRLENLRRAAEEEKTRVAESEEVQKTTTKRVIPDEEGDSLQDPTSDSLAAASLPPSTKKAHLD